MPWSAQLRTKWVNGSLTSSSTWRSSSVSAPFIASSICLPSSADRSRMIRGSFCHALPIGCIRVFITASCSSAVTFESRCNGTLKSDSSWRRTISRSWLRVRTSSETVVMRWSSVSTWTRIDWLAMRSPRSSSECSAAGLSDAGLSGAGLSGATARGPASSRIPCARRPSSPSFAGEDDSFLVL